MGNALIVPCVEDIINANTKDTISVKIPIQQICNTLRLSATVSRLVKDAMASVASTQVTINESGGVWVDLHVSFEIVNEADALLDALQRVKNSWMQVQDDLCTIIANVHEPSVWDNILAGISGPVGVALLFMRETEITALRMTVGSFSQQALQIQTQIFLNTKVVKNIVAEGKQVADESVQKAWNEFMPSLRKDCQTMHDLLASMLPALVRLNGILRDIGGGKDVVQKAIIGLDANAWMNPNNLLLDKSGDSATIDASCFPLRNYTVVPSVKFKDESRKRKRTLSSTPATAASHVSIDSMHVLNLVATPTCGSKKNIASIAQDVSYKKIKAHLDGQKVDMANDPTKFHAMSTSVSHLSVSKDSANAWTSFETNASHIQEWAITFVAAMIDAPIEAITKEHIFELCETFYHNLQTTSLKMQDYRLSIKKIAEALGTVVFVLVPPASVMNDLIAMADDDSKVQKVQAMAKMNQKALSTNLKYLSTLLNSTKQLDDLKLLSDSWKNFQKSSGTVQKEVQTDIDEFKKKMKTLGWISMAFTAVVSIAAIAVTMGAAAPVVVAEAAAETATEAAIETAAEAAVEASTEAISETAIEEGVNAGSSVAESTTEVTSSGSKALKIITSLGKGLAVMGIVTGLTEGDQKLVDYLTNERLAIVQDAIVGLDDLADDANKVETMLFFIYKDFVKLTKNPVLDKKDPLAPLMGAWDVINVKPLLTSLQESMDQAEILAGEIQETEDAVDLQITGYNEKVYQPLLKIFHK